ncbi:MAG: hypothetical protein ACE5H6_04495, partial [Dehalococcoidia bacterium]
QRISRLEKYEKWKNVTPFDFETIVGKKLWARHWDNCKKLHDKMREAQDLANQVKDRIQAQMRG